jgi:hypothetical protein
MTAEMDMEYYRRKQNRIAIRHASGDTLIAVIEVVSPGNKASQTAVQAFVAKVAEFLELRVHLLIIDVLPPTRRAPQGVYGAIWEEFTGREYEPPQGEPLTLTAFESAIEVRTYVEPLRVGSTLTSMPLYLEPGGYVLVPLERTYNEAFAAKPRRWRTVLESANP